VLFIEPPQDDTSIKREGDFIVSEAQIGTTRLHTGKLLNLDLDEVRFPDGSTGKLEMVRHPGASAVVPLLSDPEGDDPQVLLLRQYRYAADGYLFEIPAGRLDNGEEPDRCAHRELQEETGCTAARMELLTTMFTTPGFTDERIHLFLATGLTRGEAHREKDEFAETVILRLSQALEMIKTGEIKDGKTIVGLLFVAGYRSGQ